MTLLGELRRLLGLPQPYRLSHFKARERWRPAYNIVASALLEHLEFKSVLDIGCGNGFLLDEFERAGKQIKGLELSPHVAEVLPESVRDRVQIGDFNSATGLWDLVCCVEVAEHISARRSLELVEALSRTAGQWIYFTAAPPGQPGRGHINCRPMTEWLQMFEQHGFEQAAEKTLRFRQNLLSIDDATWLINNSVLLHRSQARVAKPSPKRQLEDKGTEANHKPRSAHRKG